ncbi:hypothetical protein VULLAG_LOCUS135 [Vulpes lagopus]
MGTLASSNPCCTPTQNRARHWEALSTGQMKRGRECDFCLHILGKTRKVHSGFENSLLRVLERGSSQLSAPGEGGWQRLAEAGRGRPPLLKETSAREGRRRVVKAGL